MYAGPRLASSQNKPTELTRKKAAHHHRHSNDTYTNTLGNVSIARQRDDRVEKEEV
jgi:hypothetical protein